MRRELRAQGHNEWAAYFITTLLQTSLCPAMNPPGLAQGISQPLAWPSSPTIRDANVKAEGGTQAVRTSPFPVLQHQPGSAAALSLPAPISCH